MSAESENRNGVNVEGGKPVNKKMSIMAFKKRNFGASMSDLYQHQQKMIGFPETNARQAGEQASVAI